MLFLIPSCEKAYAALCPISHKSADLGDLHPAIAVGKGCLTAVHHLILLPRASHFFRLSPSSMVCMPLKYGNNLLTRNRKDPSLIPGTHVKRSVVMVRAGNPSVGEETGGSSGLLPANLAKSK